MKITRQAGLRALDLFAATVKQRGARARGAEIENQHYRTIRVGAQKRREQGWIDLQAVFESYFVDDGTHQPSTGGISCKLVTSRAAHVVVATEGRLSPMTMVYCLGFTTSFVL